MKTDEILQQVAKEKNMTPKAVEEEIRKAIREAMKTSDPHAQALWKQLSPDGKEPSIAQFLDFCIAQINAQKDGR